MAAQPSQRLSFSTENETTIAVSSKIQGSAVRTDVRVPMWLFFQHGHESESSVSRPRSLFDDMSRNVRVQFGR